MNGNADVGRKVLAADDVTADLRPILAARIGSAAEEATTLRVQPGEIAQVQRAGIITVNRSPTCR